MKSDKPNIFERYWVTVIYGVCFLVLIPVSVLVVPFWLLGKIGQPILSKIPMYDKD